MAIWGPIVAGAIRREISESDRSGWTVGLIYHSDVASGGAPELAARLGPRAANYKSSGVTRRSGPRRGPTYIHLDVQGQLD